MKSLSIIKSVFLAIVPIVAMVAVSCDNENPTMANMPESVDISCNAGDHPTFSFSVGCDWQLSSDATWCRFVTSAGKVLDTSGKAGDHTITLEISDENIKDEPTWANITMKMGDKKAIVAKVERGAKQIYMNISDAAGNNIDAIEIGYGEWKSVYIEANFRFAAVDYPKWIEFNGGAVTGAPDEVVEAQARIIPDGEREQYAITKEKGHVVTFSDESGTHTFEFPVVFGGMSDRDLSFEGPTASNFGWEVSLDGKSFRQTEESTGTMISFDGGLKYAITALNHDYEIILLEKVVDRGIPSYVADVEWMNFDKATLTLSVDATEHTRFGMVVALPRGIYDEMSADIKGSLFESDDTSGMILEALKYDYLNLVINEFTQTDFTERGVYDGMYVYHSLTTYEIPCTPYTDAEVMAKYGVTEAYTCPFPLPRDGKTPSIVIDPRTENWTTDSFSEGRASVEFYYKERRLTTGDKEFEMGENKDEVMATQLYGPKDGFTEEVYTIFKVDGEAKKLLVVTPPVE